MLLAVLDLFEAGHLQQNLVPYDEPLLEAFDCYWQLCCLGRLTNPMLPYWHMKASPFWRYEAKEGFKNELAILVAAKTKAPPRKIVAGQVAGVVLSDELYGAALDQALRSELRQLIIGSHFGGDVQQVLADLHRVVVGSFAYASALRQQTEQDMNELFLGADALDSEFTEETRNIAFRRVVVGAYDHFCAFCGARIQTPSGRSAVQAAHIVPFSVCRNNDPRNGLALCPLHHWAFDQGMLGVNDSQRITINRYAHELPADATFLALHKQSMRLPTDQRLAPSAQALAWHHKEVFSKTK